MQCWVLAGSQGLTLSEYMMIKLSNVLHGACPWPYAFDNQEEKLPLLQPPKGWMQVTHEWRQLFHTWLAEATVCVSAERGSGRGGGEGRKTVWWDLNLSFNHLLQWLELNKICCFSNLYNVTERLELLSVGDLLSLLFCFVLFAVLKSFVLSLWLHAVWHCLVYLWVPGNPTDCFEVTS